MAYFTYSTYRDITDPVFIYIRGDSVQVRRFCIKQYPRDLPDTRTFGSLTGF